MEGLSVSGMPGCREDKGERLNGDKEKVSSVKWREEVTVRNCVSVTGKSKKARVGESSALGT